MKNNREIYFICALDWFANADQYEKSHEILIYYYTFQNILYCDYDQKC